MYQTISFKKKTKINNNKKMNNSTNATIPLHLGGLNLGLVTDYLDYITRVVSLFIHFVYMLFLIYFKEFQTRSMIFLHHVNIISMIYCIHYVFWIGNQTASFENKKVNSLLFFLKSEAILKWGNLKDCIYSTFKYFTL